MLLDENFNSSREIDYDESSEQGKKILKSLNENFGFFHESNDDDLAKGKKILKKFNLEDEKFVSLEKIDSSQKDCYNNLKGKLYKIIDAPPGWGKTTVMNALIAHDILKEKRKNLVIVPQSHIGEGFFGNEKKRWSCEIDKKKLQFL